MAIIIEGKTICPICKGVVEQGDNTVAFSPFMANDADPLSTFNDAAYHAKCFAAHPLAERCRALYEETHTRLGTGRRACTVCAKEIDNPDDYFTLGCLTSDESSRVYEFNWVQLHRSCIPSWTQLEDAMNVLKCAFRSGELNGAAIENLLSEIEGAN